MINNRYQAKSAKNDKKKSTTDRHNGINRYQIDIEGMECISVYIKSNGTNIDRYQTDSDEIEYIAVHIKEIRHTKKFKRPDKVRC